MPVPTTIYDCCIYLHYCEFLCGGSAYFPSHGNLRLNIWTRLYALAMVGVCSGSMCYTTTKLVSDPKNIRLLDNGMVKTLMVLTVASAIITYIHIAVTAQFKARQLLQLYASLNLLDRQLESQFHVVLNYGKLQRNHRLICWLKAAFFIVYAILPLALVRRSSNMGIVMLGQICYAMITFGMATHTWAHINFAELLLIRTRILQKLLIHEHNWHAVELLKQLTVMIEDINVVYAYTNSLVGTYDFVLVTYAIYVAFSSTLASMSRFLLFYYYGMCMIASVVRIIIRPIIFQLAIKEFNTCYDIVARWKECGALINWRLHHQNEFEIGYKTSLNNTFNLLIIAEITKLFAILNEIGETLFGKKQELV